ncbi:tetratricopeptide repeat protein [Hymenobacter gummosus]|nr:tetratricopeptide repeat protein [Hymenobacter gummosus]
MLHRYRRFILIAALGLLPLLSSAQATEQVRQLAKEGVALHLVDRYQEADAKYQQALKLEPNSQLIKYLMALNYTQLDRHAEAIPLLQEYIDADPAAAPGEAYVSLGTSLSRLKKLPEAIKVYEQGIKRHPTHQLLYFNMGQAYLKLGKPEDAIGAYRQSARLNPQHPTSALYLGVATADLSNRIPAVLELSRFLLLAPTHRNAPTAIQHLYRLVGSGVKKTGANEVSLTMNADALKASQRGRGDENFGDQDMLLSLMSAGDYTEENRGKTPAVRFAEKMNDLFKSLGTADGRQSRKGFAWEFYAPYFAELQRKGYAETCAYLLRSADSADEESKAWLAAHAAQVADFQAWSAAYAWPKG